ncbi:MULTISPECIES: hypothetical protein [unclassified Paenibacillus]|uniref:hypothetical protein n=1 Tax=unclassified Paenibacillus TaxID=185978 RepID=UPI002406C73B|nr:MULTISPECIES: hypothetical protein [unclassified Paenibacillus]MDF9845070.1 hypothetical protein [Paenibacillus sp. PastF-2]MDF9851699.1 hypothetical protein [Paenibacillus sp. PastM-2]MDF9858283.1 hypothetical protein [Paenibacillus sp. PastF-1]MDH6483547.1 hypothetical protein [Paenibacillus sp. PastH-2]MDH6510929.1 hypothetical protein [Paenibacillus sp. PastM-3]
MNVHYLCNIIPESKDSLSFLMELIFAFAGKDEFLYFEYNVYESDPGYSNTIEKFTGKYKQEWFRPESVQDAIKNGCDFLIEAVVLTQKEDMDSWKFKLSVVESPETIELMVTENIEGDFQELLGTSIKPFLDQGVKVLTEEMYNDMIKAQYLKYGIHI